MGSVWIRVIPRSSRNTIGDRDTEGRLKVKLTAPPVDGEANKVLVRFLAKRLGVSPGKISIRKGETSRNKLVHVEGQTDDDLTRNLTPD